MSVVQIAFTHDGLCDFQNRAAGAAGVEAAIHAAVAALPATAPIVILLHGKGYRPGHTNTCPHRLLFADTSPQTGRRYLSWPRRLGIAASGPLRNRGLAVGFGWDSFGDIWSATQAADHAAPELARLIALIRVHAPDRPVDLVGHSLGVRVMLGALARLQAGDVGRMILMAGAEFGDRARAALSTPAGRHAEVINVMSRENDLFDWLFETALAPFGGWRAVGAGLGDLPNAVDIQIDGAGGREGLARLGFRLPEPRLRICHWSVYLRPGVFRLYRGLIYRRDQIALADLRAALSAPAEARWARLRSAARPLPFDPGTPTLRA